MIARNANVFDEFAFLCWSACWGMETQARQPQQVLKGLTEEARLMLATCAGHRHFTLYHGCGFGHHVLTVGHRRHYEK